MRGSTVYGMQCISYVAVTASSMAVCHYNIMLFYHVYKYEREEKMFHRVFHFVLVGHSLYELCIFTHHFRRRESLLVPVV